MEDKNLSPENSEETKPQIHVNEYGETKDSAVVVEESDRTVLLTENETIIIPKEAVINIPPKNRERKVYGGMWGTPELITVGTAMLAVLATILLFVFLVLPAKKELSDNKEKRNELGDQLVTARLRYGNIKSTKERVSELIRSVDDFESGYLSNQTNGQAALYQQINGLISAYGLTNTAGPDYAPLEIADPNRNTQQSEQEKGRSRAVSIYPGTYITMTLDGSYQNLRQFIREIETNRNLFVVITSVELEPSENKEKEDDKTKPVQVSINNQPTKQAYPSGVSPNTYSQSNPQFSQSNPQLQNETKVDRGKTHGETVTLRLEMAAYFRRPNFQPQTASVER